MIFLAEGQDPGHPTRAMYQQYRADYERASIIPERFIWGKLNNIAITFKVPRDHPLSLMCTGYDETVLEREKKKNIYIPCYLHAFLLSSGGTAMEVFDVTCNSNTGSACFYNTNTILTAAV